MNDALLPPLTARLLQAIEREDGPGAASYARAYATYLLEEDAALPKADDFGVAASEVDRLQSKVDTVAALEIAEEPKSVPDGSGALTPGKDGFPDGSSNDSSADAVAPADGANPGFYGLEDPAERADSNTLSEEPSVTAHSPKPRLTSEE